MANGPEPISVLCVDDNEDVAKAIRAKLARTEGFRWADWLATADHLVETVARTRAHLVLLDLDMPGKDPLTALRQLGAHNPEARAIVYSGHVERSLVDAAVDAGAWGYLWKNDGEDALIDGLRRVAAGEFAMSPAVRRVCDG